ncbi:MAG: hypothetical protein LBU83_02460 [Bacteroidales bacterium]|jgi:hypothetical protein|nr:hypothetical protein [Bacteroidales bacterium]
MRLIPPFPQGKHFINRGFQPTGRGEMPTERSETLRPTGDNRRFQPTG